MKHIVTDEWVGVGTIFVEQQTHDHSFYTFIMNKSIKQENRPKDKCLVNPKKSTQALNLFDITPS